jgi:hypothetical protein
MVVLTGLFFAALHLAITALLFCLGWSLQKAAEANSVAAPKDRANARSAAVVIGLVALPVRSACAAARQCRPRRRLPTSRPLTTTATFSAPASRTTVAARRSVLALN